MRLKKGCGCAKKKSSVVSVGLSEKKLCFSGIHGEAGIKRSKVIPVQFAATHFSVPLFVIPVCVIPYLQVSCADDVVKTMINHMTNPDSQSHLPIKSGTQTATCLTSVFGLAVQFVFECNK